MVLFAWWVFGGLRFLLGSFLSQDWGQDGEKGFGVVFVVDNGGEFVVWLVSV